MHALLASFGQWLEQTSVASVMGSQPYAVVVASVAHFFSLFLLVGTSVVIDLRLLGLAGRRRSLAPFAQQLLPWTWMALGVAAVSGFLMFAPEATTFFGESYFLLKLAAIALAAGLVLVIQWNIRKWDQMAVVPAAARAAAFLSLALWIGALISALEIAQYANV
jgi:hypothetical protein